jgi:hypothetical protein
MCTLIIMYIDIDSLRCTSCILVYVHKYPQISEFWVRYHHNRTWDLRFWHCWSIYAIPLCCKKALGWETQKGVTGKITGKLSGKLRAGIPPIGGTSIFLNLEASNLFAAGRWYTSVWNWWKHWTPMWPWFYCHIWLYMGSVNPILSATCKSKGLHVGALSGALTPYFCCLYSPAGSVHLDQI